MTDMGLRLGSNFTLLEADGETVMLRDEDGKWHAKEDGWTLENIAIYADDGERICRCVEFYRNEERLGWLFSMTDDGVPFLI